jgi:hypothetical protein
MIASWLEKLNGDKLVEGYTKRVQFLARRMQYDDPDLPDLAFKASKYKNLKNNPEANASLQRVLLKSYEQQVERKLNFIENDADGGQSFRKAVDILSTINYYIETLV